MSSASFHASRLAGAELSARLYELATFSDDPSCLTRVTLGQAHKQAAARVGDWMREAGLAVRFDALGTVVGRRESAHAGARTLLIGSHIDTVRNAGRYDGNFGVVAGIAVAHELQTRSLPFAIEILAFGDEEGGRFPSTLTGSRAVAGTLDPGQLDESDADGVTRRAALRDFGVDPQGALLEARHAAGIIGYLELHIEQGPVLEAKNLSLGLVSAISGATRGEILVRGVKGHAGTLPMSMRHDALTAAAEIMLEIERIARSREGLVATIGHIETPQGAVNTVPGLVRMSLDLRHQDDAVRSAALADMGNATAEIAGRRGVQASFERSHDMPATPCDPALMARLEASFRRLGHDPFRLPSGAGHDAMSFRGRMPCAMVFTRCKGGVSHHPDEYASADDLEAATRVLHDFVLSLA